MFKGRICSFWLYNWFLQTNLLFNPVSHEGI